MGTATVSSQGAVTGAVRASAAGAAALAAAPAAESALEKHAMFFDPEKTGHITCAQTWRGMKRLGVPWWLRVVLTPIINLALGFLSGGPPLVIDVHNIAKGKHPYDSGTFDDRGEIDARCFAALLPPGEDAITAAEMDRIITERGDRKPEMGKVAGFLGHVFSKLEVAVLFRVASDVEKPVKGTTKKEPAMSRARLQSFYDGTLFQRIADERGKKAPVTT